MYKILFLFLFFIGGNNPPKEYLLWEYKDKYALVIKDPRGKRRYTIVSSNIPKYPTGYADSMTNYNSWRKFEGTILTETD